MIDPELQLTQNSHELVTNFTHKLVSLDTSEMSILTAYSTFIDAVSQNPSIIYDLLNALQLYSYEKQKKLPYIYLVNYIAIKTQLENSAQKDINEHIKQPLFHFICRVFPQLYSFLDPSVQDEITKIVNEWKRSNVFSENEIRKLEFLLKLYTQPEFDGSNLQNEILFKKVTNNEIKLDDTLCEYNKELNLLNETGDNKHRENVLKKIKEIIIKQTRTYFTHLHFVQDLDKMLDKIKTYKEYNRMQIEHENSNMLQQ